MKNCKAKIFKEQNGSCDCAYCFFGYEREKADPTYHGCANHEIHCGEVLKIEKEPVTLKMLEGGERTVFLPTAYMLCCCGQVTPVCYATYEQMIKSLGDKIPS